MMTNDIKLAQRIDELETKITFQDELVEQLNQVVIAQQNDIRKLILMVENMNTKLHDIQPSNLVDASQEAPPPHY